MPNTPADIKKFGKTINAFDNYVNTLGPDVLYKAVDSLLAVESLTLTDILYALNLSFYDPYIFIHLLPRIYSIPVLSSHEKESIYKIIPIVWSMHYPLLDNFDLAYELGILLFRLEFYESALEYLNMCSDTNKNYASEYILICYYKLKNYKSAISLLEKESLLF